MQKSMFQIDPEIKQKLRAQYGYVDKLSSRKKKAIQSYTADAYVTINEGLLLKRPMESIYSDMVEDIDIAFRDAPPTEVPIIVFRGVTRKHTFGVLAGYISTSYDIDRAFEFADKDLGCCIFVITIPAGSKVLPIEDISKNRREGEILLPRSSNLTLIQSDESRGMEYFYLILDPTPPPREKSHPSPELARDKIVNLLVENTQSDEIDLFGVEEAVKMTASSLKSIVKVAITDEEIKDAIMVLSK